MNPGHQSQSTSLDPICVRIFYKTLYHGTGGSKLDGTKLQKWGLMDGTVVKAKVAKGRVDQSRKVVSATFHVKYRLAGPGSGDQFIKENENHTK